MLAIKKAHFGVEALSGSGKSASVDLLCNYKKYGDDILLPKENVYILGLASKTAAHYDNEAINKAKLIYIEELQKAGNSLEMTELLKNLGEGKENSRKVRDQANREVVDYTIKGDKGVVYTLALENQYKNDAEMKRRYVVLTTDVSQKQTKSVVKRKGAERFAKDRLKILTDREEEHLKAHIADCMTQGKIRYENPFAEYLASKMPTPDQKIRSFTDHYFNLIEACALYHYKERVMFTTGTKKPRTHLVISIQDIILINLLYSSFFNCDIHSIPPLGLEILDAFKHIDVKKTVNVTRNMTISAFEENDTTPKVWAGVADVRDSLKENQNIILSHKVAKDTCDALYNAGYLVMNSGAKGMIEYCVADKVTDFNEEINWEECFQSGSDNMKNLYSEHFDEWYAVQQDEGKITFRHPILNEDITLDVHLKNIKAKKHEKTKTILRSNSIYNYIQKIQEFQPLSSSQLGSFVPLEVIDQLVVDDLIYTDDKGMFMVHDNIEVKNDE